MIFLREINPLSEKLLERIYNQSEHHQVRQRAHCLILASQGMKVEQLMKIFKVSHKTIYNWFERWESKSIVGLYDKAGRGRKQKFNQEQKEKIKQWAKEEPRQVKKVMQKIKEQWGIETSKKTITRVLKEMKMSWHRMRRCVGDEPLPHIYEEKKEQLEVLKKLDEKGEIDLNYLDESGFCTIPSVPSGWQDIGEYIEIKSRKSSCLNVLGIMNRRNHLETYISSQTINSDVVITCIDAFFPQVDKPTVIVVDQASIHTSDAIWQKLEEWKERNITIFELPTYSPELNLIEILWRFIKYEWLPLDAYKDWKTFVACLEKILREVGTNYVINFV
jgi:transposase